VLTRPCCCPCCDARVLSRGQGLAFRGGLCGSVAWGRALVDGTETGRVDRRGDGVWASVVRCSRTRRCLGGRGRCWCARGPWAPGKQHCALGSEVVRHIRVSDHLGSAVPAVRGCRSRLRHCWCRRWPRLRPGVVVLHAARSIQKARCCWSAGVVFRASARDVSEGPRRRVDRVHGASSPRFGGHGRGVAACAVPRIRCPRWRSCRRVVIDGGC